MGSIQIRKSVLQNQFLDLSKWDLPKINLHEPSIRESKRIPIEYFGISGQNVYTISKHFGNTLKIWQTRRTTSGTYKKTISMWRVLAPTVPGPVITEWSKREHRENEERAESVKIRSQKGHNSIVLIKRKY